MPIHPRAGKPVEATDLINVPKLISHYYSLEPDLELDSQKVSFGTSGHRGSSSQKTFNEMHILAIAQAICDYRRCNGVDGPLFLGRDTHALSECAYNTTLEVLVANGVQVKVDNDHNYVPTPVISHAIVSYNRANDDMADGIVITPSHNPPQDGGIKYNPSHGGPAGTEITNWIAGRANELLSQELSSVKVVPLEHAMAVVREWDLAQQYINDLDQVIDMQAIAKSGIRIGVDAMGGAGAHYWRHIADKYGLDISVRNEAADPSFRFMTLDKDGKIRMDCSSPYAMASLIDLKQDFDLGIGNDPDYDRHGIVTPTGGLMNPNHYLAVAVDYLCKHRPQWSDSLKIGKTLVTSALMDRVVADNNKTLLEVPVGFKWFVDGLRHGELAFGGEESAGAAFLRRDGQVWCTDKDGIILGLLAAEILAVTGKNPQQYYQELVDALGAPVYARLDAPANAKQKQRLSALKPADIKATTLAGEPILSISNKANGAKIGGLKISTENGWFAARPSGTEDIYKIYCESFVDEAHLDKIKQEAQEIVASLFG